MKGAAMRNRWEDKADKADDGFDEPVTLTGQQLRSLKRGAMAGTFALILALVAVGLAAWNMFGETGKGSGGASSVASASTAPTEGGTQAPAPTAPTASPAPTVSPAPTPAPATARSAKPATAARHRAAGVASAMPQAPKPVTESFNPSPVPPAMTPMTPAPVAAESHKPVGSDSSAAH
jgi:hypothetical protein